MTNYRLAGDPPGTWESPITPGMITAVRRLGSPRAAPDGASVAYTAGHDGRTDLYVVPSGGGLPRQLTTDRPIVGGNYAWTPNSRAIVYTSGGALWRIPATGGIARHITEGAGAHLFPRVSPDGRFVALVADRHEEIDIGVAPLPEGDADATWPLRISSGPDFTFDPRWAPDGSFLVWMAYDNRRMPWDESRIVVSYREGMPLGETRVVAAQPGYAHVQPRVAPDGRRVAFLSDRSGWLNVWMADIGSAGPTGGEARPLVPEEHEHGGPFWPFDARDLAWSPDGRRIAHTRNVRGRVGIALLDPDRGERTLLTDPDLPGAHGQLSWCGPDAVVCAYSAPDIPTRIVRIAVPGGERTVLADGAPAGIDAATAVYPEHVSYAASDGQTAHALLYTPPRPAPAGGYPLLVLFHGGPTAQALEEWNGPLRYFVGRGWAVLQSNYRGSTGYGKAYKDALNGMWGEAELRDGLGGVAYLAARGVIDRTRVVAWGGSSGGYAVLYALTRAPGQFAAGVSLYGISDLVLLDDSPDRFERYYNDTLVGPLPRAWALLRDRSPIDHVDAVRDPLLILHGGKDDNVPVDQSERFVEALRRHGVEHEYHIYPDEGHGWARTATVRDYLERMDSFLARHVLMRA